jgi:hypothetical protein
MKRIIMMLTVAALMVAALTITSAGAFAAAPDCDVKGTPGCKDDTSTTTNTEKQNAGKSPGFNDVTTTTTTEKQRGNLDASGTDNTEESSSTSSSACTNPGGQPNGGICR